MTSVGVHRVARTRLKSGSAEPRNETESHESVGEIRRGRAGLRCVEEQGFMCPRRGPRVCLSVQPTRYSQLTRYAKTVARMW